MEVILVSADQVKTYSNISENTSDKMIFTAILDAQQIELQSIIGSRLLDKICSLVKDRTISGSYKELLDNYIQPFLIRQVASEIIIPISYKIGNFGVAQSSDDHLEASQLKDISFVKNYYLDKANTAKKRLQDYLISERLSFPELNEYDFPKDVFPNLYSSTSCGIWLGGVRGKSINRIDCLNLPSKPDKDIKWEEK